MRKTQGLEDFKIAPRIGNDMRPATAQLFKGKRLPRLVRKTAPSLRVAKQMLQAIAQDHRRNIKHELTVAR
jgi:D-alanyl-D-alanine dipeptidase